MYIFFRKNVKEDPAEIVSGGQTQSDRDMDAILVQFQELFSGIGVAKIPPIQICVPEGGSPASSTETETSAGVHDEASQEEVGRVPGGRSNRGPTGV